MKAWAAEGLDLILTTGARAFHRRDRTPEAIAPILDREVPGIMEAARSYGQERMPLAIMSRGIAGVTGRTLVDHPTWLHARGTGNHGCALPLCPPCGEGAGVCIQAWAVRGYRISARQKLLLVGSGLAFLFMARWSFSPSDTLSEGQRWERVHFVDAVQLRGKVTNVAVGRGDQVLGG